MLYFGKAGEGKPNFDFMDRCKKYLERPTDDVFIEKL